MNILPLHPLTAVLPFLSEAISRGGEGLPFVLVGFFMLLGIASLVLWIWSLIHCIQNRMLSDTNRLIGIILIVVLGLLGSLIYLFLPREKTPQR